MDKDTSPLKIDFLLKRASIHSVHERTVRHGHIPDVAHLAYGKLATRSKAGFVASAKAILEAAEMLR